MSGSIQLMMLNVRPHDVQHRIFICQMNISHKSSLLLLLYSVLYVCMYVYIIPISFLSLILISYHLSVENILEIKFQFEKKDCT